MDDLLKVSIKHSTNHLVFPRIILGILVVFLVILLVQAIQKSVKTKTHLLQFRGKRFFIEDFDKLKLFGTVILLALYAFAMPRIGFIVSGILFISLFHILFVSRRDLKNIAISVGISSVETVAIWLIFSQLLNVTLP